MRLDPRMVLAKVTVGVCRAQQTENLIDYGRAGEMPDHELEFTSPNVPEIAGARSR